MRLCLRLFGLYSEGRVKEGRGVLQSWHGGSQTVSKRTRNSEGVEIPLEMLKPTLALHVDLLLLFVVVCVGVIFSITEASSSYILHCISINYIHLVLGCTFTFNGGN